MIIFINSKYSFILWGNCFTRALLLSLKFKMEVKKKNNEKSDHYWKVEVTVKKGVDYVP